MVYEGPNREYKNLARVLNELHHIDEEHVKQIMLKVLIAVNHLHNNNIMHLNLCAEHIYVNIKLDVKLSNIGLGFGVQSMQQGLIGN